MAPVKGSLWYMYKESQNSEGGERVRESVHF